MTDPSLLTYKDARAIAKETLLRDLRTAFDDADVLLELTAAQAGERIADMRGRLQRSLATARGQIEEMQKGVSTASRSMISTAETCMHESPWKTLGAVAITSFVLGFLVGRR
jgi:ElaB/YqjD/DUF883 family membrane-anchored ribosome-binding protein